MLKQPCNYLIGWSKVDGIDFFHESLPISVNDKIETRKEKIQTALDKSQRKWIYSQQKDKEERHSVYTIGMHKLNMPELIIMGAYVNEIAAYIDFFCVHQYSMGKKFLEDEIFDHALINQPMAAFTIADKPKKKYMQLCYDYYGTWDFETQQILIADKNKKFPWNEGFDPRLQRFQLFMEPKTLDTSMMPKGIIT
jgi:hypothetical protein